LWIALFLVAAGRVHAVDAGLVIEITGSGAGSTPIAVVPFGFQPLVAGAPAAQPARGLPSLDTDAPEDIAGIVSFDLARSGEFAPLDRGDMLSLPTRVDEVFFYDWRTLKVDYLVIGRLLEEAAGVYAATFELYDVTARSRLATETYRGRRDQLRDIAHVISDDVYEKLTGLRGAFSTKLAYVLARGLGTPRANFKLQVADVDGARNRTLFDSGQPLLSPSWSPDAKQIAYVSFESGRSAIHLVDVATGRREKLAEFKGINGAPAFSPDGRQLAIVLSRDGSPDVYLMELATRRLRQVTRSRDIDTEPSWTPDGAGLVFTSGRGGLPQIYQIDVASGLETRLTFEGDYNARGRMLPDNRHLVYVHRRERIFHIAVLDLQSGRNLVLTRTSLDESPSVAPNGRMLIYATLEKGRGILAVVSVDGRAGFSLPSPDGDVREPAWSPFIDVKRELVR
jgi:TolB protein